LGQEFLLLEYPPGDKEIIRNPDGWLENLHFDQLFYLLNMGFYQLARLNHSGQDGPSVNRADCRWFKRKKFKASAPSGGCIFRKKRDTAGGSSL
jgi:hypothetical protein